MRRTYRLLGPCRSDFPPITDEGDYSSILPCPKIVVVDFNASALCWPTSNTANCLLLFVGNIQQGGGTRDAADSTGSWDIPEPIFMIILTLIRTFIHSSFPGCTNLPASYTVILPFQSSIPSPNCRPYFKENENYHANCAPQLLSGLLLPTKRGTIDDRQVSFIPVRMP